MAKIISLNNYKGGSTKTTTSVNLAKGLANLGNKVLLIDLDSQGNSSSKFLETYEDDKGIVEVFEKTSDIKDCIHNTKHKNLYILPAKLELEDTKEKMNLNAQTTLLRKLLSPISDDYDYIIIDNNPSYRIMLQNCVYCADLIIVPVNIDNNSIKGVDFTIRKINEVISESLIDLNLDVKVLITKVSSQTKVSEQVKTAIRNAFRDRVLNTEIRLQVSPAEKQSFDEDYFMVDHTEQPVGLEYSNLVNEIVDMFKGGNC